jgi:uncharacterized protein YegJ (DUF2314 family)
MRIWFILLLFALVGCKDRGGNMDEKNEDNLYSTSGDDEEMNAAIQEAIRNYPLFEQAMQQPDSSLTDFAVKMKFAYGDDNAEHMWVSDLHLIGGQFFGVLNNDPVNIEKIKAGDTLRVIRDKISDWMYVKNGKLQGGYTLKVIYKNMNEKEKKEFRESLPFEIE